MLPLILASSSPYRRELLARLNTPFDCISPNIDESPNAGEAPEQLVMRLAQNKAEAIANNHHNHLIIASDQVACLDGEILTKPDNFENAVMQLSSCSGKRVVFHTGLCLLNSQNQNRQFCVEPFTVYFRDLTLKQIERYLKAEEPYDCAGSFKMEGLGISLFSKLEGDDPNALIGLPLIRLINMLQKESVEIP